MVLIQALIENWRKEKGPDSASLDHCGLDFHVTPAQNSNRKALLEGMVGRVADGNSNRPPFALGWSLQRSVVGKDRENLPSQANFHLVGRLRIAKPSDFRQLRLTGVFRGPSKYPSS